MKRVRIALPLSALAAVFMMSAAAAQSTSSCSWVGSSWVCNTTKERATVPLDYGAIIASGAALVPKYERSAPEPRETPAEPARRLSTPVKPRVVGNGNSLFEECSNDLAAACAAYISGAASGFAAGMQVAGAKPAYCPPAGVTGVQMRDVVFKFLRDHPEERHLPAAGLVAIALHGAFPC